MSAPTLAQQSRSISLRRFLAASALAAGGCGVAVGITVALGYGSDMHVSRVLCLVVFLFSAGLIAFWPRVQWPLRVLFLFIGVAGAGVSWLLLPCGARGMPLVAAVGHRDLLRTWMSEPTGVHLGEAGEMKAAIARLAQDYPSLAQPLEAELHEWKKRAEAEIGERFAKINPNDLAAALALQIRLNELDRVFPDDGIGVSPNVWVNRAVKARVADLVALAPSGPAAFDRTAPERRALAAAFPDTRKQLIEAEEQWGQQVAASMLIHFVHVDSSPREIREECCSTATNMLELKSLDDSPRRFLEARRVLFRTAHEAVQAEIRLLHEAERFDRALAVALDHQFVWTKSPGVVGPEEQKAFEELRERCRGLCRPGGDPEPIPPPRVVDTAPEPRPKAAKQPVECILTRDPKLGPLEAKAFTVELRNNTDKPIELHSTLPFGMLVFLDIAIEDAAGKRISPEFYDLTISSPYAPPARLVGTLAVDKGEKIEMYALRRYFEKPDEVKPGKYRVRVKFRYGDVSVISEWSSFEIAK